MHPRPRSEVIDPRKNTSGDADKGNSWREDLQHYERNLEAMTSMNLDQSFKDELHHVDQWFSFLSETERTATVYTLLQHSSQVQMRFFISVLQQMMKRDPLNNYLTPANPDQDMQSQLTNAMAKAELEANQRLLAAAGQAVRRPPSAGRGQGSSSMDRHSFALGDTEDYAQLMSSMGNLSLNNGGLEDYARIQIPRSTARSAAGNQSMFASRNRPRSVIEGDTSLLFPTNSSTWLNLAPQQRSSMTGTIGRMGPAAERPKSADISLWTLPSLDISSDDATTKKRGGAGAGGNSSLRPGWGIPSTMQFGDLSSRHLDVDLDFNSWDKRRRAGRNIPNTVPETDERNNALHDASSSNSAVDAANVVLSSYDQPVRRTHSPVPSASASAPFSRRHLAPPGMEQRYGQFLNPNDAQGFDEYDYLSDHSEASNVSGDRGHHRRRGGRGGGGHGQNAGGRTPKDKKPTDVVDMELLEDVPAWFRTLRLHKYNNIFESMKWQDIIKLTDEELEAKGVAALGARRKMLKVFEQVKAHCEANNIKY